MPRKKSTSRKKPTAKKTAAKKQAESVNLTEPIIPAETIEKWKKADKILALNEIKKKLKNNETLKPHEKKLLDQMSQEPTFDPGERRRGLFYKSLTATDLGACFNVTKQAVGGWHRKQGCPRNSDGTYNLHDVLDWRIEIESQKRAIKLAREIAATDDPMMAAGSGNSKYLEAYRKEKAREARRRNDQEEGRLVDAIELSQALYEIARIFREESEILQRNFGPDVGEGIRTMVANACEKFENLVQVYQPEELLPTHTVGSESGPTGEGSNLGKTPQNG